jgi:hypothetical protein
MFIEFYLWIFMDIDGVETMGNMMAMIHHDAPLDYFAG